MTPPRSSPGSAHLNFFSENVDAWGAAEWFNRLATAIRQQDAAVLANDDATMEICRNVAASSAMRLVRDYEQQVRSALSTPAQGYNATQRELEILELRKLASHWKERHDEVLQKHIECCGVAQAPANREAIARIIDPGAFADRDNRVSDRSLTIALALKKADAIIDLSSVSSTTHSPASLTLPAIAPTKCFCCNGDLHLNSASYSCDQQSTEHFHIDDLSPVLSTHHCEAAAQGLNLTKGCPCEQCEKDRALQAKVDAFRTSTQGRPHPEVVAAVQQAIMKHPHFEGGSATAFGFANTAIDAYLSALSSTHHRTPSEGE
jgi:hypothetical protein